MFEPIGKDTFEAACRKIDESDYVIDTGCPVRQMNAMLKDVLEYAAEKKKLFLKTRHRYIEIIIHRRIDIMKPMDIENSRLQ